MIDTILTNYNICLIGMYNFGYYVKIQINLFGILVKNDRYIFVQNEKLPV